MSFKNCFVFYGNSSLTIGTGHIMRLLALAQWAPSCKIIFIYKKCLEPFRMKIEHAGFENHPINSPLTHENIMRFHPTHLIVDDYQLSDEEWQIIFHLSIKTIIFDDAINKRSLPVDLIINSAPNASLINYQLRAPHAQLCLGTQFTLLRKEFIDELTKFSEYSLRKTILITLGGTDIMGITPVLCKQLLKIYPQLNLEVVIGNRLHLEALESLQQLHPHLHIHLNSNQMAKIMSRSALAISAAGSTLYELACMQVPTIALVCADNQASVLTSPFNNTWYHAIDFRTYPMLEEAPSYELIKNLIVSAQQLLENYRKRLMMHQATKTAITIHGGRNLIDKINLL